MLKGTKVSTEDREVITTNLNIVEAKLKEHFRELSVKLGNLMEQISLGVNCLDSYLGFHMDLFAHCDRKTRNS